MYGGDDPDDFLYDFSGGNTFRISDISDTKMKILGRYSLGTGKTT